jgi:hypothetical protein
MLITVCSGKREIKLWSCGSTVEGAPAEILARTFDVNNYIHQGLSNLCDSEDRIRLSINECKSSWDGTKLIVSVTIQDMLLHRYWHSVSVVDIDSHALIVIKCRESVTWCPFAVLTSDVDDRILVVQNKTISVRDISSGSQGHDHYLDLPNIDAAVICSYSCCFGRDSNTLITADRFVVLTDLQDRSELSRIDCCDPDQRFYYVCISRSKQLLAVASDSQLILFETQKWTRQSDWTVSSQCFQLHFTADDSKAASCHNDESDIFVWSTASGTLLFHLYGLSASWWDNDTKLVVNSGHDGQATVCHGDSGDIIFTWSAHDDVSWVAGTITPLGILL